MAHCHVCETDVPDLELLDHLRLLHPDRYGDGPETWPDGEFVVIDTTVDSVADAEEDWLAEAMRQPQHHYDEDGNAIPWEPPEEEG